MPRASAKDQILSAALETLHAKGFNGSGVQDITSAAEVPKGSFYNHFASKEDVGVAALEQYWQRILGSLGALADPKTPALARLQAYFRSLDGILRQHGYERGCFVGNMGTEMSGQSRPVRERLALILAAWSRAIESCVREAQADGAMRRDIDARAIAAFLLNAWEGTVMRAKVDRDGSALDAFEAVVFTSLRP